MKLACLLLSLPVALSAPAYFSNSSSLYHETVTETTDRYLFFTSLPDFLGLRAQSVPRTLDWSSDGCTSSPNNPFGFPFEPACQRHDFGYRNYKSQRRFDSDGRYRVDLNFEKDMVYQCESDSTVSAKKSCYSLAQVYYYAVRAFGGFSKRDQATSRGLDARSRAEKEAFMAMYLAAVEEYDEAVKQDQADGNLPVL